MASLSFLATLLVCIIGLILLAVEFYFFHSPRPEQISLACTGKREPTDICNVQLKEIAKIELVKIAF